VAAALLIRAHVGEYGPVPPQYHKRKEGAQEVQSDLKINAAQSYLNRALVILHLGRKQCDLELEFGREAQSE